MPPSVSTNAVFLNIPYDDKFKPQYLAYIVGLASLGLEPRATLDIPSGERRLDRIFNLIQSCRYSIHDLSRVELDRHPPFPTPRFNMPFELGLTVAWSKLHPEKHGWFVCESKDRRIAKSLSDLNGTDAHIHDGTVAGIMRELGNAFVRRNAKPTVPAMLASYELLQQPAPEIQIACGANSLFGAQAFQSLCFAARAAADLESKS